MQGLTQLSCYMPDGSSDIIKFNIKIQLGNVRYFMSEIA